MTSPRSAAHRRHLLSPLALSVSALGAQALPTGRIVGRVIDAGTGQGIPDAGVQVVGTTLGVQSGVDGRYSVASVPAGTVTITSPTSRLHSKDSHGIAARRLDRRSSRTSRSSTAAARIAAQVVTASVERGTVNEALDKQRTAVGVVNAVTAEQISKSPDGDAAQAVQRVSGVTVQDGKLRVRPRTRRAIYHRVAQRRARPESRAREARRAARPVSVGAPPVGDDDQDIHAGSAGRFRRRVGRHQDARVSRRAAR